jgi:pilus assembly protein Flp/PilA
VHQLKAFARNGGYFSQHPILLFGISAVDIFKSFLKNQSGATAIEYGLIAGLIAVVIIGALTSLGTHIRAKFNAISGNLS